jgi:hypothetical protein
VFLMDVFLLPACILYLYFDVCIFCNSGLICERDLGFNMTP